MAWLWSVGPVVIVCVSVLLVLGARKIRLASAEEQPEESSNRLSHLQEHLSALHDDLRSFEPTPGGDDAAGPADR